MSFSGKRILITGGTRGIGRAIALNLLDRGLDHLMIASEESEPFEWKDFESRGAIFQSADLEDGEAPAELVQTAVEKLGGLDGLVHCAGVYLEGGDSPADSPLDIWNTTVNIKARGGYLLAHAFSEVASDGASFVGVTSINAEQSEPNHLAYDPACAALGGVIRAFAIHYAPRLRFNALAPGLIHTRLTDAVAKSKILSQHAISNIPLERLGAPEDCAGAAAFLLDDESAYMTGETLYVDGGIRANQMSRSN